MSEYEKRVDVYIGDWAECFRRVEEKAPAGISRDELSRVARAAHLQPMLEKVMDVLPELADAVILELRELTDDRYAEVRAAELRAKQALNELEE